MPQPRANRKRKASGIFSTEAPPKYRFIVIEKHVNMRKRMLHFLNKHHKAFNENAAYELFKYLTEEEAKNDDDGLRDDEEDQDVQSFGEHDF